MITTAVLRILIIILPIALCSLNAAAQEVAEQKRLSATDAVRVLFVGKSAFRNQYGNMMADLAALGAADGVRYQTDHSLAWVIVSRWNLATLADEASLREKLRDGDFDYVIIHHRNDLWDDDDNEPMFQGAEALHEVITRSGGRTVLWMGYEWGPTPARDIVARHRLYWETAKRRMDEHSIDGRTYPALMTPTMLFVEDMRAKWGSKRVVPDGLHLNRRALFAASVLLHTYVSGNDPRRNTYTPSRISKADVEWIKNKAWQYFAKKLSRKEEDKPRRFNE
jgi:hypothetical protein